MAAMWAVTAWAISRDWESSGPWLLPVVIASGLWAGLEVSQPAVIDRPEQRTITVFLRHFIAWVALALASLILVRTMATLDGVASAWATSGRRASGLIMASGLIVFGNALPTLPSPRCAVHEASVWQRVRRFTAWTVVLTGLGVWGSWIALDPVIASQTTNRLLAACFMLVCGRTIASHLDRSAIGSPMN